MIAKKRKKKTMRFISQQMGFKKNNNSKSYTDFDIACGFY